MGGKTIAALAAGALALGGVGVAAVATEDSATSPDVTVQAQAAPPHPATESTGQYSATFHWGGVTEPGQTGYYVYQNGVQVADITNPTYTFTGLDCGTTFTFGVAAHNGSGGTSPTSTTSYSTPACAGGGGGGAPVNTTQPYFTASTVNTSGTCSAGCAIQGQQLQVTTGGWSNSPTSYTYQWQACTTTAGTSTGVQTSNGNYVMSLPTTGACANATGTGATTATYTVAAADVGKALTAHVTATNGTGSATTTASSGCNTGLMTTAMSTSSPSNPSTSTFLNNGQPGCSPISAVVGTGQLGTTTSGAHFCTNAPTTCGFADISNTGPPPGTTFQTVPGTCTSPSGPGAGCGTTGTGWTYSGGQIVMSTGGTLKNVSFNAGNLGTGGLQQAIQVSGVSNVTIEDNNISIGSNNTAGSEVISLRTASSNVTIQNNNLTGLDNTQGHAADSAVRDVTCNSTGVTIANNNMWWTAATLNNICAGSGWSITSNYIHDMSYSGCCNHFDGIQFEGNGASGTTATFANNTVLLNVDQTLAIGMATDNSTLNNARQVTHNLLAGGSYTVYGGAGITNATTNSTFSNNIFSSIYLGANATGSADASGSAGPVNQWGTGATNTWTGNRWDSNGSTSGF